MKTAFYLLCSIPFWGVLKYFLAEGFQNKAIGNLKFFISHGSVDQVIPVDWARKAKPFLENLGLDVTYKEYPVGHGVAPQNFFDFKNWLEK